MNNIIITTVAKLVDITTVNVVDESGKVVATITLYSVVEVIKVTRVGFSPPEVNAKKTFGSDAAIATPAELKKPAPPLFLRNPLTGAIEFTGKGDGSTPLEKLLKLNQPKGLVGARGYEKPGTIQPQGLVGARGYEKPGPLQDVGAGNHFDLASGYGKNPRPCAHCGGIHD